MTIPKRMLSLGAGAGASVESGAPGRGPEWSFYPAMPRVRYGLTDRLELNLLGLRFAILDDAPPDHASTGEAAARSPLSLAVTAGLDGFWVEGGDGGSPDISYAPIVGVHVRRRWWRDAYVWAILNGGAWVFRRTYGWIDVEAGASFQVTGRLTLHVGLSDRWWFDTPLPSGRWREHLVSIGPNFALRPWHWLTIALSGAGGVRLRPTEQSGSSPPQQPVPTLAAREGPRVYLETILFTTFHF